MTVVIETDDTLDLTNPHLSRNEITELMGGIRPQNLKYYRRAFVHKSVKRNVKRAKNIKVQDYMEESNETLEFVGDSVLNLIVTHYLFTRFPQKDEGSLTRLKIKIVCREGCARFARKLNFGKYILTTDFIKIDTYADKILEDTFEAFVAAIYLDLGFEFAKTFVIRLIENFIDFDDLLEDRNYKDILLRFSQSEGYQLPVYEEIIKQGPDHNSEFTMSVTIIKNQVPLIAYGKGHSKKIAEQMAAKKILEMVDQTTLYKFKNRDK